MSVTYRNGVSGDGKALADLFRESFIATFGHLYAKADLDAFLEGVTAEAFEDELASPDFTFRLAEDSGQLAGFVKLGPDNLPGEALPGTIELYQLYVLERWHGSGIARELMDWAIAEARSQAARYLTLTVYIDNHRARRFYERYGFEEVGKYVFMVGNHADDDRIMRLTL
ncbi:GNAT family N-acetyltransferase [Sphingomonas sp. HDW15A]|uniref:GNAT family N-acetyltransferase n=1 Tax=Sphingomonas sp. HDW15A TaxID=2714942 RepID=UPI0014073199|nr:GNAT family N-acetyltransferase [Sphingomonas sp. HDW15A]QIK96771.1 GNAT family N-acetyltransferase [Sphingomonas sp. HDW15A]